MLTKSTCDRDSDEVWLIPETGEVFLDYQLVFHFQSVGNLFLTLGDFLNRAFVQRKKLLNDAVWRSSFNSHSSSSLTFQQVALPRHSSAFLSYFFNPRVACSKALAAEEKMQSQLDTFPPFLAKAVLQLANRFEGSQYALVTHVRAGLDLSMVVGEGCVARFSEQMPAYALSVFLFFFSSFSFCVCLLPKPLATLAICCFVFYFLCCCFLSSLLLFSTNHPLKQPPTKRHFLGV